MSPLPNSPRYCQKFPPSDSDGKLAAGWLSLGFGNGYHEHDNTPTHNAHAGPVGIWGAQTPGLLDVTLSLQSFYLGHWKTWLVRVIVGYDSGTGEHLKRSRECSCAKNIAHVVGYQSLARRVCHGGPKIYTWKGSPWGWSEI